MPKKTVTRVELTEAVCRENGLTYYESAGLVESVLDHVSDALVKGEDVKITKFGTFSVRSKTERMGRNPQTGEDAVISPRRVIKFIPSSITSKQVDVGNKT